MKKKIITHSMNVYFVLVTALFAVCSLFLSNGCTLHFKAEKMQLDTKPPEAKISNTTPTNTSYELASIELLKDN